MPTLYIIRGIPGCGKSTLASQMSAALGIDFFEADMYHYLETGQYDWKPENVYASHKWCQDCVQASMLAGNSVIVSNTSTTEKELKPYLDMAAMYGHNVVSLVVENRHGKANIHNVPEKTLVQMESRFSLKLR